MSPSHPLLALCLLTASLAAADMERIRIAPDGRGFVLADSGKRFTPWGFNYDHDLGGQLLEEYWDEHWPVVEKAFQEMQQLGANVVRMHLQFGAFMQSPTEPRPAALTQLRRLIQLAEQTKLYLDLTGLGCYHKDSVPEWYNTLNETDRWQAQANFWQAIANTCAHSPAIFCYDLMNEPVVPGGNQPREDWLGPGFGGKHFVQYITLDRAGRERPAIARAWIHRLVAAIREHDPDRLITVGLVPWSLDRPGLTSGFVPEQIADQLDFIAVHIYPERENPQEALTTLQGFAAVGKPVIIEETFPLKCSADELRDFILQSRSHASGWIGFYWGKSPADLRSGTTLAEAITLNWLELFQELTPQILAK
jgi:hypothetical protein